MFADRVTISMLAAVCSVSMTHAQTSSDWPTFGGAPGGAQHSPLDQINVDNVDELETLSTAADERKSQVPGESIKHYIDIDDYPEFFTGTLPHTFDEMVAMYGLNRVEGNGTVPWGWRPTASRAFCRRRCATICCAWDGATAMTRLSAVNRRSNGST